MNVLITGGAGYIGYSLVQHILSSYNEVKEITIYDNLSRKNYAFFTTEQLTQKPVKFIDGDILDGRKLEKALKGIDVVYHLAAKVTTPYADYEAHFYDQINHWGTAQIVNAIENSDVKHLIYLSSAAVYGSPEGPADESTPAHPFSFYGISKLSGEEQVQRLMDTKKVHILRSANVYGYNPSMRIDAVVNRFMFEANFKNTITINGTGEQTRPFIHVDKLAYVCKELVNQDVESGIYNVAEHNFSVNEIVDAVKGIYPDVETISINYNIKMRDIDLALPCKLMDKIPLPKRSLMDELHGFKVKFAF